MSKEKSVVLHSIDLSLTGAPLCLMDMAVFLADMGYSITFLSPFDGPLKYQLEEKGFVLIVYDGYIDNSMRTVISRADFVVANTLYSKEFVKEIQKLDVPIFWWIHEIEIHYNFVDMSGIDADIRLLAAGPLVASYIRKYYDMDSYILPIYVNCDYDIDDSRIRNDRIRFVNIGSIHVIKGQNILIEAISKLPFEYRNRAEFIFVGKSSGSDASDAIEENIRLCADELDEVAWYSELSKDKMFKLYGSVDAVIVCSIAETTSAVAVEGFACEKPVIVSDVAGVVEYMTDGYDGYMCPVYDSDALAKKIMYVMDNYEEAREVGKRGRTIYDNVFSKDAFKKNLTKILDSLHDKHKLESKEKNNINTWMNRSGKQNRNCVGCSSCVYSCSENVIGMTYNETGHYVATVDESMCIECGVCLEKCPVRNTPKGVKLPEECFALQSETDFRMQASSGGIFPLLSETFVKCGGYVAGAYFDENMKVCHGVTNDVSEVKLFWESKYAQSDMGNTFPIIEQLLDEGNDVLFSGCPCQVAGLKAYLGADYDNLYTIDVVCHGVPSPMVFEKYLKEITPFGKTIKRVSFRDKDVFGWASGLFVEFDDGSTITHDNNDVYLSTFLKDYILNDACYNCVFKGKQYSDITLGDFWGIDNIQEFDDGYGTSFVTCNTNKGAALISGILPILKRKGKLNTEMAVTYNKAIANSFVKPAYRRFLFENINNTGLETAVNKAETEYHFDIGVVAYWSENYGNALTNYGLYSALKKMGYSVLMIDNNFHPPVKKFYNFAKKYYNLSGIIMGEINYKTLNMLCDAFVVGSDQGWVMFSEGSYGGTYFQLDWVDNDKLKLSYAPSFGGYVPNSENEIGMLKADLIPIYKKLYQRFDATSVREALGVDIMKNVFDLETKCVIDPVFLVDKSEWLDIAGAADVKVDGPFICAYLLDPTLEERNFEKEISQKLGGVPIYNIVDGEKSDYGALIILQGENVLYNISVEEWLYYMSNAEFIITDSFHGTCFATIFEKRFVSIKNRGKERFDIFAGIFGLEGRILDDIGNVGYDDILKEYSCDEVKKFINPYKDESKAWLEAALKGCKTI
ncbi:MAG: polysaccharide pyruvyl transferase family protein [Clostridium sp.]|nr:polysaccharide pyruvyl transferase family protein [Clostridium sp.]MCM1207416.1 polysaccharide pyruvyl transferase family protein [Ruminococcus sp.]